VPVRARFGQPASFFGFERNRGAWLPLKAARETGMPASKPRTPRTSDTAALLFVEELLVERLLAFGAEPDQQRLDIEAELSKVRRELERLGLSTSK
jgi:hypothetical protein